MAKSILQKQFSHHCFLDWPIFFVTEELNMCPVKSPTATLAQNLRVRQQLVVYFFP